MTRRNLNIEHFKKIFEFLQQYSIDLWKVYEFIPEGRGLSNYENLSISDEERMKFIQDFKEIQDKAVENKKFASILSSRNMRGFAYFIIQPNGTVMIPVDKKEDNGVEEEVIGDLKNQSIIEVSKRWSEKLNRTGYSNNFKM